MANPDPIVRAFSHNSLFAQPRPPLQNRPPLSLQEIRAMTPEILIEHLRKDLLERNIQHYRDLLGGPLTHPKPDSYALSIRDLYARLSESDRDVLFSLIRQTIIDTASSIFVVLDGDACLPGFREDFSLRYGTDTEPLNGELQDLFLAAEEELEDEQRT